MTTKMKLALAALVIVVLALLGCGTSTEEKREKVNICDTTLQKCVEILGQDSKDKCYTTYHACITRND